jgi:hypothetical protein
MPSVERPALAILLDSFMPQPYVTNITGIKPNVSPRPYSSTKFSLSMHLSQTLFASSEARRIFRDSLALSHQFSGDPLASKGAECALGGGCRCAG